jgi:starch phosphorylase
MPAAPTLWLAIASKSCHKINFTPAKTLTQWQTHLLEHWYEMRIDEVNISATDELQVNQPFQVRASIYLGALSPDDVQVELYEGVVAVNGEMQSGTAITMGYQGKDEQGRSDYSVAMTYTHSGLQGLSLRILPKHEYLNSALDLRLVLWAQPDQVTVKIGSDIIEPLPAVGTEALT